MPLMYYTQKSYDLYDAKFSKFCRKKLYEVCNTNTIRNERFRVCDYLTMEFIKSNHNIKLKYRFGEGRFKGRCFSFRTYAYKSNSGQCFMTKEGMQIPIQTMKIISKTQPIPLGKIRVHNFKGYGE